MDFLDKNSKATPNAIVAQHIIEFLGDIISPNNPPIKLPTGDAAIQIVIRVADTFPLIPSSVFKSIVVQSKVLNII